MPTLIADTETNGFLATCDRFYMVQLGEADGTDAVLYVDDRYMPPELRKMSHSDLGLAYEIRPLYEGLDRLHMAEEVVFHNGLGFDFDVVEKFFPGVLKLEKVIDTLVLARMAEPFHRGHTLADWGRRLGVLKDDYHGGFDEITADLLRYSEQDVVVGRALYNHVKHVRTWRDSWKWEHETARAIQLQERNGFTLDVKGAEALALDLRTVLDDVARSLEPHFPPIERSKTFIPKVNNKSLGRVKGVPEVTTWLEPFVPSNLNHQVERLQLRGWEPTEFTPTGKPVLSAKVLAGIDLPEARLLLPYAKAAKKLGQLSDGKEGWLRHVKPDGRVHGRCNTNGCVTSRMSHSNPNMANVDKDARMRGVWTAKPGWKMVGCDAEGLEARMMAHYLDPYDKGAYTTVVLSGNSKDRTDVHSNNLRALIKKGILPGIAWSTDECPGQHGHSYFDTARGGAKTILYALMYGAQDGKLGLTAVEIIRKLGIKVPPLARKERGALVRAAIMDGIKGLEQLTNAVQARVRSHKFLTAIDGRHLPVRSQHAALNVLLQGGGACVMKVALCLFLRELHRRGYEWFRDFGLLVNVHDEWQTECRPEIAEELRVLAEDSICQAGVLLAMRCPLAGKASIGANWAETH